MNLPEITVPHRYEGRYEGFITARGWHKCVTGRQPGITGMHGRRSHEIDRAIEFETDSVWNGAERGIDFRKAIRARRADRNDGPSMAAAPPVTDPLLSVRTNVG
jgi:hypothetical protein